VCVCVCVCVLTLVTQHANRIFYAPYSHLWPVRLCNHFPHYLMNGTTFVGKKINEHKMWFDFLYYYYLQHHSEKNSAIYYNKCTSVLM